MGTHLVGFSRDSTVQLTLVPIFQSGCEVRARPSADASAAAGEPRFVCRKGGPALSMADCEACPRFRGWHHGGHPDELAARCGWAARDAVHSIMTDVRVLVTFPPETPWAVAEDAAVRHDVHHLPVLSDGRLVGLVSRSDFYPRPSPDAPLSTLMVSDVLAVREGASLAEAVATLSTFKIGCLPVVADGGRLAGIVTRGDLLRVGVPGELLAIHRCASCGSHHGVRASSWMGETVRCTECLDADPDAAFSIVSIGEPD